MTPPPLFFFVFLFEYWPMPSIDLLNFFDGKDARFVRIRSRWKKERIRDSLCQRSYEGTYQVRIRSSHITNSDYVGMVAVILGADNARRAAATEALETVRRNSPEAFVTELMVHIRNVSAPPELRQFSAVMLRQCVATYYEHVWKNLSAGLQALVKTTLLEILRSDDRLRRKASNVVGQLATHLVKAGNTSIMHHNAQVFI